MQQRHGELEHNEDLGRFTMLVLIPPPDVEKPDDVEMSNDPEKRRGQIIGTVFRMMDGAGTAGTYDRSVVGWVERWTRR